MHEKLEKLAEGADIIIASPAKIAELRQQGLPIQDVPGLTLEELFNQRWDNAVQIIYHLPELPPAERLPYAIRSLYEEARFCILFGLNGAAIVLCGNLIEYTLKYVGCVKECGGPSNYCSDKWNEFEQMDFSDAINRAKRAGLVSSRLGKRLHEFRNDIRNPYSHHNISKITQEVVAGAVKVASLETGEFEEEDIPAKQDPSIQAILKPITDKQNVIFVFSFADEVVNHLLANLEKSIQESSP